MKKDYTYYEAAKIINNAPNIGVGVCEAIAIVHRFNNKKISPKIAPFKKLFHPSKIEMRKHAVSKIYWLYCYNQRPEQNKADRIIALLLMHEIVNTK